MRFLIIMPLSGLKFGRKATVFNKLHRGEMAKAQ